MPSSPRTARVALAGLIVVFVVVLGRFGERSYFFQDDFFWLQQAREQGLTWRFLSGDVFGSFAPLFKLGYQPILGVLGMRYELVLALELGLAAAIVWVSWRISTLLVAPGVAVVAALASTSFTTLWIPTILWPADALHVLPATLLGLVALEGFLRHELLGSRHWLAASVAALALALGFWSKALLVPVYAVLLVAFVLAPRLRDAPAALKSRWRVWALYALPVAGYSSYVALGDYSRETTTPATLGRMVHVVATSWSAGFFPGLFGLGPLEPRLGLPAADPPIGPTPAATIVAAQLVLAVIASVSLWRRPAAWRLWAFFVAAFIVNQLYMGYGRGHTGTVIGREYRYLVDLSPLLGIVLAFAFGSGWRARASPLAIPARALPPRAATLAVALVTLGLGFQVVRQREGGDGVRAAFPVDDTRRFVRHFRHDIARIQRDVARPALLDRQLPPLVMAPGFGPYARAAGLLPVVARNLRFGVAPRYGVGDDGHVRRVALTVAGSLDTRVARCLRGPGTARWPLALAHGPFSSTGTVLLVTYRTKNDAAPILFLTSRTGEIDAFTNLAPLPMAQGHHGYVRPLRDATLVEGVRLDLYTAAELCVTSLRIVLPRAVGAPGVA